MLKKIQEYYALECAGWFLLLVMECLYLTDTFNSLGPAYITCIVLLGLIVAYYSWKFCHLTAAIKSIRSFPFIVVFFNAIVCAAMSILVLVNTSSDNYVAAGSSGRSDTDFDMYLLFADYFLVIMLPFAIILIESSLKISKFTRFVAPIGLCVVALYNTFYAYFRLWDDYILCTFNNGNQVTARTIQGQAWLLLCIFLLKMVFRVFVDPNHERFSLIESKINRKAIFETISFNYKQYKSTKYQTLTAGGGGGHGGDIADNEDDNEEYQKLNTNRFSLMTSMMRDSIMRDSIMSTGVTTTLGGRDVRSSRITSGMTSGMTSGHLAQFGNSNSNSNSRYGINNNYKNGENQSSSEMSKMSKIEKKSSSKTSDATNKYSLENMTDPNAEYNARYLVYEKYIIIFVMCLAFGFCVSYFVMYVIIPDLLAIDIIEVITAVFFILPSMYVLYRQCWVHWHIIQVLFAYYLHQFRCLLLLLSVFGLFILQIYKVCALVDNHWYASLCRILASNFAIFLCLIRDCFVLKAMPFYASIFMVILLFSVCIFYMIDLEMGEPYDLYPRWLLFCEKQLVYQVLVVTLLLGYCVIVDPQHEHFVLIRGKIKRYHIFGKNNNVTNGALYENITNNDMSNSRLINVVRPPRKILVDNDKRQHTKSPKSYVMIALTDIDNEMIH